MTPQDFIQKWGPGGPAYGLNEEQGAKNHFLDLCELLAFKTEPVLELVDHISCRDALLVFAATAPDATLSQRHHSLWRASGGEGELDYSIGFIGSPNSRPGDCALASLVEAPSSFFTLRSSEKSIAPSRRLIHRVVQATSVHHMSIRMFMGSGQGQRAPANRLRLKGC